MASDRKTASKARLCRMAPGEHMCRYGLKSKDLLEREGFEVEDYKPASRGW